MKKILVLFVALIAVISTLSIGTYAYFQDTETSSTNSITAGTLDLTINGGDSNTNILTISSTNGYPGNSGTAYTLIKNIGSFSGELDIIMGTATNTESTGSTEFESDSLNGSDGELGGVATIVIWIDFDKDGTDFDDGTDIVLMSDGTFSTDAADYAAAADTVDAFNTDDFDAVLTMAAADEVAICVDWQIPFGSSADNTFQGDAVSFGASFVLEQASVD